MPLKEWTMLVPKSKKYVVNITKIINTSMRVPVGTFYVKKHCFHKKMQNRFSLLKGRRCGGPRKKSHLESVHWILLLFFFYIQNICTDPAEDLEDCIEQIHMKTVSTDRWIIYTAFLVWHSTFLFVNVYKRPQVRSM